MSKYKNTDAELQAELAYFEAKLELDKQLQWNEYVEKLLKELDE